MPAINVTYEYINFLLTRFGDRRIPIIDDRTGKPAGIQKWIDNGFLKLGTLLEAKVFWVKGSLEAPDLTTPIKESEKFVFGLPTLGLALDLNPHKMLNIYAQGSGMYAGSYGYLYDAEIGVKLIPISFHSFYVFFPI
jgi:hypothetical protein